jgi:CheY-like chemotaxis protein
MEKDQKITEMVADNINDKPLAGEPNKLVEILLVEDNLSDATLTIMALKNKNLAGKLLHVKDGAEALDFIFAQGAFSNRKIEDTPHVILLDINMPKVNGLEVLKKIKSDLRTSKIPVVILTSSSEDRDLIESYKLGANSYIVKPVDFDKFTEAVTELGLYWMILNKRPVHATNS